MHAGHLLLGRPWQFDRRVLHNGYINHYTFEKDGKKITLVPLSPKEVYEGELRRMHSEREHKSEEKKSK